jgi:hypothetical protein
MSCEFRATSLCSQLTARSLLSKIPNVEVSDTTGDATGFAAGQKKFQLKSLRIYDKTKVLEKCL